MRERCPLPVGIFLTCGYADTTEELLDAILQRKCSGIEHERNIVQKAREPPSFRTISPMRSPSGRSAGSRTVPVF